jgi:hypothetical protein
VNVRTDDAHAGPGTGRALPSADNNTTYLSSGPATAAGSPHGGQS